MKVILSLRKGRFLKMICSGYHILYVHGLKAVNELKRVQFLLSSRTALPVKCKILHNIA